MKVLVASPSPRDLPEWLAAHKLIHEDRFVAKYMPERFAYDTIWDIFSTHKKYDYLVLWPDDLLVTPEQFASLKATIKAKKYPVLSGLCNLNYQEQDKFACSMNIVAAGFMMDEEQIQHEVKMQKSPIIKVAFDGFACSFIRRDVFEKIKWTNEMSSFDMSFDRQCYKLGIPLRVDTRVKLVHLANRLGGWVVECDGRGREKPCYKWVKAKE